MSEQTKTELLKKFNAAATMIDRAADTLLATLSAGIVCIVLISVFFRYVLNHSLAWSDELVRYLFVWFTLLGAAVTLRERGHIQVEYFVEKISVRFRHITEITILILTALFHAALVVLGLCWVYSTRGSYTSALQWPLNLFFYAALPCTAALALWYALRRLVRSEFAERTTLSDATTSLDTGEFSCRS